ncbi:MAG: sugar-binding protein [bacterium]|nr:sugar-binding protein [bacterium]
MRREDFGKRVVRRLALAVFLSAVPASVLPVFAGMLGDLYEIPFTTVAPVIDGVMDPVWHNCGQVFQRSYTNGTSSPDDFTDLMGWSRVMWDCDNLYLLLYTQDDVIQDVHANSWERDSWEVYFDGDNSKTEGAWDGVNDMQLRFHHAYSFANYLEELPFVPEYVEFVSLDNPAEAPSGWMTEIKLPLAEIFVEPVLNSLIGFELQQNDNDGQARDHISKWWVSEGDPSWNDASTFGTAILTERPIGETLQVPMTQTPAVIDGVPDEWYQYASPFQQNSFDNIGSPGNWPDSYEDHFARSWAAWDADNFYLFIEAWDDIIQDTHANSWERDCFEVYFDGDNSKVEGAYDTVNDMQLRFGHAYTEASQIDGPSYFGREGVEFVNVDTDLGWNLEIKLPLDGIFLEPVAGFEFGFEIQGNDNDGTARESISKWWTEVGDPSWNNASTFGTAYLYVRGCYKRSKDLSKTQKSSYDCRDAVEDESFTAHEFSLHANFPNPFNPRTRIGFEIPANEWVRLSVYDAFGREVAVPVDGEKTAGRHEAVFDATGLPSGVYFCKLRTRDQMLVRKMMLVK